MTINNAMNISLSGLNANQAALNVVSHNIANMNTEGYAKQRVDFAEVRTLNSDSTVRGQIASLSGVKIAGISTAANDYLNNYYRNQNTIYEGLQAGADALGGVADLFDELQGSGLGDSLTAFFDAANSLNQNPTDYSLRVNFVEKAKAVANKFNVTEKSLSNYTSNLFGSAGATGEAADASKVGTDVNSLKSSLENLAKINIQINSKPDDSSLKSQRDQILSTISGLANVTTTLNSNGTANVKIGNYDLVKGGEVVGELTYSVSADGNPKIRYDNKETNKTIEDISSSFTGGSIGGVISNKKYIDDASNKLKNLKTSFVNYMNEIQTGDPEGTGTSPCYYNRENDKLVENPPKLFEIDTTNGQVKVTDEVTKDPDKVAASRVDTTTTGWEKSVGNGDNALLFYNTKSEKGIDGLGGLSIQDYIISMGTETALKANNLQDQADAQSSIVDNISNQILSETGVNLDEELSNMIMYQQAYNASARVFSACVEIYDTLVNLGT